MKLYLVGGAVRRHMLGLSPTKDLDFAVEAPSFEAMKSTLAEMGLHVWQERPEFVTLRGRIPTVNLGSLVMDYDLNIHLGATVDADFTLCRAEAMYHDQRHPSEVTPAPLWVDLSRRDFTINAVAVSTEGEIIDPYSGQFDAAAHILRCVGHPEERFAEDPLRILRAVRFKVTENLTWAPSIAHALYRSDVVNGLRTLPVERVHAELNRALAHNWIDTMWAILHTAPAVGEVLYDAFPTLWLKATTEKR